jgi:tetratricopeptide (TPR) repeat protein
MRSSHDLRRVSLTLVALVFQAGCATATRGTAIHSTAATSHSSGQSQPVLPKNALVRADSAYQAGAYVLATTLYEGIVALDPSPAPIAVFRLATLRSWDNRLDEAVALYRRYIVLQPRDAEGPIALARTLAWQGHYAAAIAIYDSLIANRQRVRDASLDRAQTLAWAGRLGEAIDAYRGWLRDHSPDRDASIAYARALAWNGQLDEAEAMYTQLAKTGNAAARKGLARVIGWRGELERSEHTWRQVLETDPNDPEALTGLAQVLTWQGRQSDAETALQLALRANPSYGDARTLLRFVQADLRPSVTITGVSINDSDHNRSTAVSVDYTARAWWNGALGARYTGRSANLAAIDSRADAVNLLARWQPGSSSWQVRAEGGVTRHSSNFIPSPAPQRTIGGGSVRVSGNVGRSLTVGVSGARVPFDETAMLIAHGVVNSDVTGEAAIALPARFSLSGAASRARLTGGTIENARNAYSSTLRWSHSRNWSLAIGGRQFGYDTTNIDGYFAPRRYTLFEAGGRGHVGGNLGWNADADVGIGRQRVELFGSTAASRVAERAALSLGYRFDPARDVSASGGYANVAAAGQSTGSEYKWYTFSLRARLGF